jgi:hypothetical protein
VGVTALGGVAIVKDSLFLIPVSILLPEITKEG